MGEAARASSGTPPTAGTALAYETAPLDHDVTVIGNSSVDLWLKSTAPDTDIQVTITEVRPDGKEIVRAERLAARERSRARRPTRPSCARRIRSRKAAVQMLPAGKFSLARVEVFPFAHVFRAGSRIRVIIDAPGGSRPAWSFDDLPAQGHEVNTIGRGGAFASRIVLPVVSGVDVAPGLPACPSLRGQPCRADRGRSRTRPAPDRRVDSARLQPRASRPRRPEAPNVDALVLRFAEAGFVLGALARVVRPRPANRMIGLDPFANVLAVAVPQLAPRDRPRRPTGGSPAASPTGASSRATRPWWPVRARSGGRRRSCRRRPTRRSRSRRAPVPGTRRRGARSSRLGGRSSRARRTGRPVGPRASVRTWSCPHPSSRSPTPAWAERLRLAGAARAIARRSSRHVGRATLRAMKKLADYGIDDHPPDDPERVQQQKVPASSVSHNPNDAM